MIPIDKNIAMQVSFGTYLLMKCSVKIALQMLKVWIKQNLSYM